MPTTVGAAPDLVAAIGNTPMVELRRLAPHDGVRLYAKLRATTRPAASRTASRKP